MVSVYLWMLDLCVSLYSSIPLALIDGQSLPKLVLIKSVMILGIAILNNVEITNFSEDLPYSEFLSHYR